MSVRDEIMRRDNEPCGQAHGDYCEGVNDGLKVAADVAVEYVSKLTDQRNHFERLVTYLRVMVKINTLDDMLERGDGNDIATALAAHPVLEDELDSSWVALTDDEKREMDALINWEPT